MPTILVADDNSNIQKMVSLVFQEKGINVVAVGNGEAACRKVPEVKPDLVLADVFMPVRNGYEVCEFVKRDSRFSETPVVLLVGAFDPLDEKEARRVGADGVLKKPFVPPEPLISLVGSLLRKSDKTGESPTVSVPVEQPAPPSIPAEPLPAPASSRAYEGYESEPASEAPRRYHAEPEPEPEGREDQFSYGTASRDSDVADQMTAAGQESVAKPSADDEESQDDNTESASDWKRRRMAVDYDIPAEESANLVEHLAGENTGSAAADEVETSSGSEQIGEAPVSLESKPEEPQPETVAPEPPRVSPSEWSSYIPSTTEKSSASTPEPVNAAEVSALPAEPAAAVEVPAPEISLAPPSESAPVSYSSRGDGDDEIEKDGERDLKPSEFIASAHEERDDFPTEPPSIIPFPATAEHPASDDLVIEESSSEEQVPVVTHFSSQNSDSSHEEPAPAHAVVEQAVHEAMAQPASSQQAPMDQATIDSIVAKVVEKLEPQLHQALSQGVLKPLIQELLKGELKPDK